MLLQRYELIHRSMGIFPEKILKETTKNHSFSLLRTELLLYCSSFAKIKIYIYTDTLSEDYH